LKAVPLSRICSRAGCTNLVHKSTARYCSIGCCAQDPVRKERLRRQARRAPIVPMAHQLSLTFKANPDLEAWLMAQLPNGEEIPAGLQRLRAV
jgi:hypothetical protein